MKYNLLIELSEPATTRKVMLEDDGRTGYAYLHVGDEIVSDVWLYNRAGAPDEPSWDNRDDLPFPNKRQFIVEDERLVLGPDSQVELRWDQLGVDLYIDSQYAARLELNAFPGWSRLTAVDSFVARKLPNPTLRAV